MTVDAALRITWHVAQLRVILLSASAYLGRSLMTPVTLWVTCEISHRSSKSMRIELKWVWLEDANSWSPSCTQQAPWLRIEMDKVVWRLLEDIFKVYGDCLLLLYSFATARGSLLVTHSDPIGWVSSMPGSCLGWQTITRNWCCWVEPLL